MNEEPVDILLDALNLSGKAEQASRTEVSVLDKILGQLQGVNTSNASAIDNKAAASVAVNNQALAGEQAAQDATRRFAAAAGSDINSPEQILIQLGNDLRMNLQAAQKAEASIHAKESARIIDDPLGWLKGQLTLKQDYTAFNQAAEKANLAEKSIASVTKATDDVGRTQAGLAKKITDASRSAAADAMMADAQALKLQAERGHLKDELAISSAIQNATAEQATEAQRQVGMVMDANRWALEQERFAMAKDQFDWEKQLQGSKAKDKKSQDEMKEQMLMRYNIGAASLGLPEETNFDVLMALIELGGTDKTRINAAMEAGGHSIAAGATRVSASPAGTTSMIVKGVYPHANDPAFTPMKNYLKETWDEASMANIGAGKDREALTVAGVNARVAADTARYTNNAVASGSFYAPPPLSSLTNTRAVQNTALYQKVLATAGKDLTSAAPTPIVKLAYEAAKSGTISYEEAATGLATLYGQAKNVNNLTKRYAQIGIQPQTTFKVKPDMSQLYDVETGIDLSNYTETLRMFAILKARENGITRPLMQGVRN